MKKEKNELYTSQKIQIISYLQAIGVYPVRFSQNNAFYLSPFRNEKDASFKVDTKLNLWYDYGTGKGGNIIDLCMLINNTDVSGALKVLSNHKINDDFSFFTSNNSYTNDFSTTIKIKHLQEIQNKALIQYLKTRHIRLMIAKKYLKEVYYQIKEKRYFALAFKNDKGGFELRNKYFKGAVSPKYYTSIKGTENKNLNIFEGVFDFLSALTFFNTEQIKNHTIILNSTANTDLILNKLNDFENIFLFLDNDNTGIKTTEIIKKHHKRVINRAEKIYPKHKDFNEFICK